MTITNSFYNLCLDYSKKVAKLLKTNVEPMEIVHDVIVEDDLTEDNYERKIKNRFEYVLSYRRNTFEYNGRDDSNTKELIPCRNCQQSLPQDCFRTIYRSGGAPRLYTSYCKKCEHIKAKKRIKKFSKKQKEELGDWYIKRLLTRHKFKASEVTPEMIEEKRQEVLKMRQDGNWRTKK